jgi:rhomboid family GlyGly-CTERM serine protease
VHSQPRSLRSWLPALALVVICLGLAVGGEPVRQWARYDRVGLEAGEVWRLVTGHLVHLGLEHLLLDLGALVLIRLVIGTALSAGEWIAAALVSMTAIDAGLYFGTPDLAWYVGLSGVLHGLLMAGAFALLRTDRPFAILLLAGIAAKLAWEHAVGPLPWSAAATGGPVITAAHLYGAAGGVLFAGLSALVRRSRSRPL